MATSEITEKEAGKLFRRYPPTAGMLLVKIGRAAERWYTEALKPSGLTPRHLGVLFELRAQPTSQNLASRENRRVAGHHELALRFPLSAHMSNTPRPSPPQDRGPDSQTLAACGRTSVRQRQKPAAEIPAE